ncbi:NACHT domain-containing protein [Flavobacterium davisii]|uniref:NACHT domain-containing protein n=1 Tax=Flavobacterium columnare TaxID=996 RepID=A0A8G0P715_9FLAO|nr:NACHT domain-containing protein [Flavobacterium davisii]QYS89687.1 NACHT domain-containing protein [Flavobacterium davisii]
MPVLTLIGTFIGDKFKPLFESLAKEFGEEVKQVINNNILEYQVEEYNRNYCTKTLLHRVEPKKLTEFYQPLFIKSCDREYKFRRNQDKENRIATDSIKNLFSKQQCITLIGNAGSGKSTIIKYLFLNSIDLDFKIPIKVELRYLNDYNGNIIEFIKEKILKLNRLATNDRIVERMMNSGDFVFFLDGYDEISSTKKEKITKEIDDLVKVYNKNYYLLTSRPYTEIELLPLFHNYEVCELSDEDINQFIKKQIPKSEKELCDKIIEAVNSQDNLSYKSFLSNPLLLSMFILTFQSYSSIPQKRSEFYSQVFDALFSVHDSMSKLAFVREKQSGLSKEQIIEVLKLFSFISYFDEKFIFSGIYLNEKFNFIKEKKKNLNFENTKLINDLQVAINILNKEGTDYTFPHRSLQEYFTAIYIFSLNDTNKKIVYNKIINSLTHKNRFLHSSKDNFYLLLSELDQINVIKYALIPYFENFIKTKNINKYKHKTIIDTFLNLNQIFDSFEYVLKCDDFKNANELFNEKFNIYGEEINKENIKDEKLLEKKFNERLEKLAYNDIKPFLVEYKTKLEIIKNNLEEYLINENNSDNDIVSII